MFSFRNLLFFSSLIILIFTSYYAATFVIETNKINQEIANQNSPSDLNPLQILPKGESQSLTPTPTPIGGAQFFVNKLTGNSLQYCNENESLLVNEMKGLTEEIKNSALEYSSIVSGVGDYYLKQSTASGKVIADFDNLISDSISKQRLLVSLVQNMQNDAKNFSCSADNPSAQANLYSSDASQAINALKAYNLSVKNILQRVSISNIEPKASKSADFRFKIL